MHIEIYDFLKKMVTNEGQDYLTEESRVCSCLADLFPKYKRERNILRLSISRGYPWKLERLIQETGRENSNIIVQRLAQEFCDEEWIVYEAALYAISGIAYAKGYLEEVCEPEINDDTKAFNELLEKINVIEEENTFLKRENDLLRNNQHYLKDDTKDEKEKCRISDDDFDSIKRLLSIDSKFAVLCGKLFLTSQSNSIVKFGEDLLNMAAERENADAQLLLGDLSANSRDETQAYIWYQRAALNGNPHAAHKLGVMCGVAGKYEDAVMWLKEAAEGNVVEAQLQYGIMLQAGLGTKKNQQLALQWFRRSAKSGNKIAAEKYKKLRDIIDN